MEPATFIGFLLALALGGLIGTERELPWAGTRPGGATGFGGIRSYASIAFLGAISVWMDQTLGMHVWTIIGAILSGVLIIVSYAYSSFHQDKMGVTSEYATFITYFIGAISMMWYYTVAVITAILLLLLLSAKEYFAKLKARFSREELGDTLKFAVIALVILPLLPDARYSLLDMANWIAAWHLSWTHPIALAKFFNPHGIWLFVVVMTGVEYAGFFLGKMLGHRGGILASGFVWGIISSTATTVAMTRKSKEHPEHRNSYVVATLLASSIMFIRVVIVAWYIFPEILTSILLPGWVMFVTLTLAMLYYLHASWGEKTPIKPDEKKDAYKSPFQLIPALQFAGLIVIIKFIAILWKIYKDVVPQEISNYFLGLISGFADVDAVNFTMSEWAKDGSIPVFIAATTILIAVMSNNTVKASIAYRFGEGEYGKKVFIGFGISILFGLLAIAGIYIFG